MAYSSIKQSMERYASMSPIEQKIKKVLDWGPIIAFGSHVLLEMAYDGISKRIPRIFSRGSEPNKVEEIPTDNEDDKYSLEIFGLDVPPKIPARSLDQALEEVGRFADSDLSANTHVDYAGLLYHLYAHVPELGGHSRGNLRSVSPIEDLSYFERNHVQDFWIEPDGSLYVAINVYSLPQLENTKLPIPLTKFPSLDPKSFMGGLVDLTIFDPVERSTDFSIGQQMQIYLLPANAPFNKNLLWQFQYRDIRDKANLAVGDNFPYYAVVVLRHKDKDVANSLLEKLQQELNSASREGKSPSQSE